MNPSVGGKSAGALVSLSDETALPPEDDAIDAAMDALAAYRPAPARSFGEQAGDFIDNYRLLKLIDVGGMGEVWQAEQQAPVKQRVALKIVKFGMDTRAVVARFETERKALAMMAHPNIARIFDGGATAAGRPYFVMEYVDGIPIAEYVRQAGLMLEARLELLIQACEAIQHAHRRGIIHRDLKPSNILVQLIDGKPVLKIIDFGIAKATDSSVMAHTRVTGLGQILGTLGYMSPEQTAMDTSDVDTRSDVYSLGAIMYELVTGVAPFDLASLGKKGQDEALQVIRTEIPRRPSARLDQKDTMLGWRSHMARGFVRNELDWVVMKSLDKDPDRRYESAAEFAGDIKRLLENRPVQARPDSLTYALRKWTARHRVPVCAIGGILAAIIITAWAIASFARAEIDQAGQRAWYQRLLQAKTEDVAGIVNEQPVLPEALVDMLRQGVAEHPIETRQGLHSRLALLRDDASLAESLQEHVLEVDAEAVSVIRDFLGPHRAQIEPVLWRTLENDTEARARRFRAAAVLATYAPDDKRWAPATMGADVAEWLTRQEPVQVWIDHFQPIATRLQQPLEEDLYRRTSPQFQRNAATLLAFFFQDDLDRLVHLARQASPVQMPPLVDALRGHEQDAVEALTSALGEDFTVGESDLEKDQLAEAQARAGMALVLLGQTERVKPHLLRSPGFEDPRLHTFLIHFFAEYQVDPTVISRWLWDDSSAPSLLRAGLIALGDYGLTTRRIASLEAVVARLYASHPDPGVHGAAEWLLRHWQRQNGAIERLPSVETRTEPEIGHRWFVNHQGFTMIVIPGPVQFLMGTPADDPGYPHLERRKLKERQHERHIPRTFAIASKPLTFRDYEAKEPGYINYTLDANRVLKEQRADLNPSLPVEAVAYEDALEYCNWLSEQEGIPKDQYCYHFPEGEDSIQPKANFLSLTGYRLATEAEWEYACRSGAITVRPYGSSELLLPKYVWYRDNAGTRTWPPGRLRPNDYGFFDMLGNTSEWVHGFYANFPDPADGICLDSELELNRQPEDGRLLRSVRGSTLHSRAAHVRSAHRRGVDTESFTVSIRVARTLRTSLKEPLPTSN